MGELTQLDELIESDVLEALGVKPSIPPQVQETSPEDEIKIEDLDEEQIIIEDLEEIKEENKIIQTTVNSDDLVSMLSQLLDNKTLEITIKIKD